MPRRGAGKSTPEPVKADLLAEVPAGYEEQFEGLQLVARAQLAKMMRDLDLPAEGNQQQMALQIVRTLAAAEASASANPSVRSSDLPKEEVTVTTAQDCKALQAEAKSSPGRRIRSKRGASEALRETPATADATEMHQRLKDSGEKGLPKLRRTRGSEALGAGPDVEADGGPAPSPVEHVAPGKPQEPSQVAKRNTACTSESDAPPRKRTKKSRANVALHEPEAVSTTSAQSSQGADAAAVSMVDSEQADTTKVDLAQEHEQGVNFSEKDQAPPKVPDNPDGSLEADLLAEEPLPEGPGYLAVSVPSEATPRIRERLGHLRAVAEVEAEVFDANKEHTEWEKEVPRYLDIVSPNGQRTCTGRYRRLAKKMVNSQPIWKKVDANRWVYSGTDSTWLVGGVKQRDMDFMCRSGLLHQAKLHGGQLPHRLDPGGWRRVDGSGWVEDPDISVSASPVMQPGAPVVVVAGLRQGRFGLLVSRREEEGAVFWTTRFSDGEEELQDEQLEVRELQSGEVWLSTSEGAATPVAALAAEALAWTLLGKPMQGFAEVGHAATSVLLPEELLNKAAVHELCRLMDRHQVIFGFLRSNKEEPSSWLQLVVIGKNPKPGILALLKLTEELLPGCLERVPQEDACSSNGSLGASRIRCSEIYGGEAALSRHLQTISSCLEVSGDSPEVLAAPVGLVSLIVGTNPARKVARKFLEMVRMWSPEVPRELEAFSASIRVPDAAQKAVEQALKEIEPELHVSAIWCTQTDVQTDSQKLKAELEMDEEVQPGAEVLAVFEDGDWYDATVTDVDPLGDKVEVRWMCDSSLTKLPRQDVKPKPSASSKKRRKHQAWLDSAWRLAVFGPLRERKIAVVNIATTVEEQCPGLWTTDLLRTTEELRGSIGEDASVDVKVLPLSTPGAAENLQHLKKRLKEVVRRVALASGCYIELLRRWAILMVGSSEERSRGMEYFEWLASEERERSRGAQGPTTSTTTGQDAVRWTDSDGDQLLLRLGERQCLDFFLNGVCKVRDITTLVAEGDTLRLRGMGAAGATTRCPERPPDKEAVDHAMALFQRSVRARSGDAGLQRSDVIVVETTCQQAVWLEPVELRALEQKTKTLVVFPEGCGSNSDWRPEAVCKILVCGGNAAGRAEAEAKLQELVAPNVAEPQKSSEATAKPDDPPQTAQPAPPKSEAAEEATAAVTSQSHGEGAEKSDPAKELQGIPWPKDNQTWQALQETIFWGHPRLPRGWIRIWSRNQAQEYYLRITDGKTTFNMAETGYRSVGP